MNFRCMKVGAHKFSVEPPEDKKGTNWAWKGIVHCPYCGTDDLMHDMVPPAMGGRDLENARKENLEMTMAARKQAGAATVAQNLRDPEITLAPIQGASQYGKAQPVKVRKSIMDGIAAKMPDNALPSEPAK